MQAPDSEQILFQNATALAGQCLGELAARHGLSAPSDLRRAKGWVGELLEKALGATAQSRPVPDFEHLGIELKTLPLNRKLAPQESTFVSVVPLQNTAGLRWETSTVKKKLDCVLWIPVEAAHDIPVSRRRIGRAVLWRPSPADSAVLRADWEEHMELISLGRVDELDARIGEYLQVRPKAFDRTGLTKTTDRDGAPTSSLPRGFYLRAHFTHKILHAAV